MAVKQQIHSRLKAFNFHKDEMLEYKESKVHMMPQSSLFLLFDGLQTERHYKGRFICFRSATKSRIRCLNEASVETSAIKKEVPAIALPPLSPVWFLWLRSQFCFGQVITNRARERIHLSGVWQSGSDCETLSQLKGLSSVSTLRCLYSLIQRAETGWQRGAAAAALKNTNALSHTCTKAAFHLPVPWHFTAIAYRSWQWGIKITQQGPESELRMPNPSLGFVFFDIITFLFRAINPHLRTLWRLSERSSDRFTFTTAFPWRPPTLCHPGSQTQLLP